MKVNFVFAALFFSMSVFGTTPRQVKQNLLRAQVQFQELAIDLPFEKVYGTWKERVRENYKTASRNLTEAANEMDRDPKRAAELIDSSLSLFRQAGLLLPMYEIDKTKIDEILSRFLGAEDSLAQAIRDLTGQTSVPVKSPFLKIGNLGFVTIPGGFTHADASAKCSALQYEGSKDWALPTFKELATYFRQLKDPQQNPLFGAAASQYYEVWTGDRYAPGNDFYYVNFQREKSGTAPASYLFRAICVGTITNR